MQTELISQNFFESLAPSIDNFTLKILNRAQDKRFELFQYNHTSKHRSALAFFNEETKEFNLQLTIDLFDFCDMKYITSDLDKFESALKNFLSQDLSRLDRPKISTSLVCEKKISEWNFKFPTRIENFMLEIQPREIIEIPNGSFIVLDYCDFEIESSFSIIYNLYRDEFYCEERIHRTPDINYDFESTTLEELSLKLEKHLESSIARLNIPRNGNYKRGEEIGDSNLLSKI